MATGAKKGVMRVLIGIALIVLCVGVASAAERWHAAQVKFVYPLGDGSVVIGFVTNDTYCSNTSNPKYYYVAAGQNGVTPEGVKNILAVALAALALEKTLSVAFDDSTVQCFINRASVQQ